MKKKLEKKEKHFKPFLPAPAAHLIHRKPDYASV